MKTALRLGVCALVFCIGCPEPTPEPLPPPAMPAVTSTVPQGPANENDVRVIGTSAAGTTVLVFAGAGCGSLELGSGTAEEFSSTGLAVRVADDSVTEFFAVALNSEGLASPCSETSASYTEDSTPPAAPTGLVATPQRANNNSPTISGQTEPGATVRVYTDTACTSADAQTVQADDAGAFTLSVTVADNTTTTFYATATDGPGNTSACSATGAQYIEDSEAPAPPTLTETIPAPPSRNSSPLVRGTAEDGSMVRLYLGPTCTEPALGVGPAIQFSTTGIQITLAANATHVIHATAQDPSGNVSACSSSSVTYVQDSAPPDVPVLTAVTPQTSSSNSPVVTGTAEALATVRLFSNANCTGLVGQGSAEELASPGITVTIANDATVDFYVTAEDVAGNVSACAPGNLTYVEDSTAPAAPTLTSTTPSSPGNATTILVKGNAEALSTVRLYSDASCAGTELATGTAADFVATGLSVSLQPDATNTIRATATDPVGNVSTCSNPLTFVQDSTAPAAPTLTRVNPRAINNLNQPTLIGTAETLSVVRIFTDGTCTTQVAQGAAAVFQQVGIIVNVADDTVTTFWANATDVAGNPSPCSSTSLTYTEDSQAPALPTVASATPAGPANNNSPVLAGTAEAGSTVTIHTDSACSSASVADGTAADFATPGFTVAVFDNTTTSFYARATDAAGNPSGCGTVFARYVEDSLAPGAPVIDALVATLANGNALTLTGAAEPGSSVDIWTSTDCTGTPKVTVTATSTGSFSALVDVVDDTVTNFRATATDAASNESLCPLLGVTYTEDSTAPSPPTFVSVEPVGPANNNAPLVVGNAEANATVDLFLDSACTVAAGTGIAGGTGQFAINLDVPPDTAVVIHARATDGALNPSDCSADSLSYTEDSTPPLPPVVLTVLPAATANDNAPIVTGTAEAGSTVTLHTDAACTSAAAGTGTAEEFATTGIASSVEDDTVTTFYALATDVAQNASDCSPAFVTFTEDSRPPSAPVVDPLVATLANGNSLTLTGKAEADSTVRVWTSDDCTGTALVTVTATAGGTFSAPVNVNDDTVTTFRATATDAAFNESACPLAGVTYTEDSTPPALPALVSIEPVGPANDNSPVVIGTAEAGAFVELFVGACDVAAGSNVADAAGQFAIDADILDDSVVTIRAKATDAAGNTSSCSSDFLDYTEDSTAPLEPTVSATVPAGPANDNAPLVRGSAEAGSTVTLYTNDTCTSATAATGSAATFSSPGLGVNVGNNSTTTFYAKARDVAGNLSACSPTSVTYVEDSNKPAVATISPLAVTLANGNDLTLTGTAEALSTVDVWTSNDCTGTPVSVTATSTGTFTAQVSVGDDSVTTFRATATDAATNRSDCPFNGVTYTEDSTAPGEPTFTSIVPVGPANDNRPVVTGSAEPGARIALFIGAGCATAAGTGTANTSGVFSFNADIADNLTVEIRAIATDAANNASGCSTDFLPYVEDSNLPGAPIIDATIPVSPANNNTPSVLGSGEADSTVFIYTGAGCTNQIGSDIIAGDGRFSVDVVGIVDNSDTNLYARSRDAANNLSPCSTTAFVYREDSLAPAHLAAVVRDGTSTTSDVSFTNEPAFFDANWGGFTDARGVTAYEFSLSTSSTCLTVSPVNVGNVTSYRATGLTLQSGTRYYACVRALDAAGNPSGYKASNGVLVDLGNPTVPSGVAAALGNMQATISWTASTDPESSVAFYEISYCDTPSCTPDAIPELTSIAGSPRIVTGLSNCSTYGFAVRAVDAAGNRSLYNSVAETAVQLPVVSNVKLVPGSGHIEMSWDPVPNATDYDICHSLGQPSPCTSGTTTSTLGPPHSRLVGLNLGTRVFSVRARQGTCIGPALPLDLTQTLFSLGEYTQFQGPGAGYAAGTSLSSGADFNSDRYADVVIGMPGANAVAILSGFSKNQMLVVAGPGGRFGEAVAAVPDLDRDGVADFAVGAPTTSAGAGAVYVYSGRDGYLLASVLGVGTEALGSALAGLRDVNSDGAGDIAVGAPAAGGGAGEVRVLSGANPSVTLQTLTGAAATDALGSSVANAGDVDRDGSDDIISGAPGDVTTIGKALVYSGRTGNVLHTFVGSANGDGFGRAVSAAGDVNADGRHDLIVGAPTSGLRGAAFVYDGSNGSLLFSQPGVGIDDRFGTSVAAGGDINGDGIGDVIVGAPEADPRGFDRAGSVYAFAGPTGSIIYQGDGPAVGYQLGFATAGADIDSDGLSDIIAGAPGSNAGGLNGRGAVLALVPSSEVGISQADTPRPLLAQGFGGPSAPFAVLGQPVTFRGTGGGTIFSLVTPSSGAATMSGAGIFTPGNAVGFFDTVRVTDANNRSRDTRVASIDHPLNATLTAASPATADRFGWALAGLGDVDGDGVPDFAVGVPRLAAGRVVVYSGASNLPLITLLGEAAGDEFGHSVAAAGDLDGDRHADFIVGAPKEGLVGSKAGAVYVYSGINGALIFKAAGTADGDQFGSAVSDGRDIDGDGQLDVLVGAPFAGGSSKGEAYALDGMTGVRLPLYIDNTTPDPISYDYFRGVQPGANLGWSVAALGDLTGDGKGEFVVGAPSEGATATGAAYVVSFSVVFGIRTTLVGSASGSNFGTAVAALGDVNGDGRMDFAVGAPKTAVSGNGDAGQAVIFSGDGASLFVVRGSSPFENLGNAVAAAGDINGDGRADILVGAPGTGTALVLSGKDASVLYRRGGVLQSQGFGASLAAIGDVNRDGRPDFIVGAYKTDVGGFAEAGRVDLFRSLPPATPPLRPVLPIAAALSSTSIEVTWSDASTDETRFVVEVRNPTRAWTAGTTVAANSTSASVTGLEANSMYIVRVKSANGVGDSYWSPEATVITPP